MKRTHIYLFFFACLLLGFTSCQQEKKLPRIGIAGISIGVSKIPDRVAPPAPRGRCGNGDARHGTRQLSCTLYAGLRHEPL